MASFATGPLQVHYQVLLPSFHSLKPVQPFVFQTCQVYLNSEGGLSRMVGGVDSVVLDDSTVHQNYALLCLGFFCSSIFSKVSSYIQSLWVDFLLPNNGFFTGIQPNLL
jgi:hypothetical protein